MLNVIYTLIVIFSILFFSNHPSWSEHRYQSYRISELPQTFKMTDPSYIQPAFGDLNGDGKIDMVLADPTGKGQITIFLNLSGLFKQESYTFRVDGQKEREPIGSFVAIADVNEDGKPDLVIGREEMRSAFYLTGPLTAPEKGRVLRLDRSNHLEYPGRFVAYTDLDGDSRTEFVVKNESGEWQVFRSPTDLWFTVRGLSDKASPTGILTGSLPGRNGPSVLMGDPGAGAGGALFIFSPPQDSHQGIDLTDRQIVEQLDSPWPGAGFGKSIALWDMNGDGENDILVSCENSRRWAGMYGPISRNQLFQFDVLEAPPLFWVMDFQGDGMQEIFFGPPFRVLANSAPTVQLTKALQQENGWARIELTIADRQGQDVDIDLEYRRKNKLVRAAEALFRGNRKVTVGAGKTLEWNVVQDYPDQMMEEGLEYQLIVNNHHFMYSTTVVEGKPFPLDTKIPTVQLQMPEFREDGKVVIVGTAADDTAVSKIQFRMGGGDWQEVVANFPPLNEPEEEFSVEFPGGNGETYQVDVQATDKFGNKSILSTASQARVVVPAGTFGLLSRTGLTQNASPDFSPVTLFPNPYSIRSTQEILFEYGLNTDSDTKIFVYSIGGTIAWQANYTPGNDGGKKGLNKVTWDGRGSFGELIASGIYAIKLIAGGKLHSSARLIVTN